MERMIKADSFGSWYVQEKINSLNRTEPVRHRISPQSRSSQ